MKTSTSFKKGHPSHTKSGKENPRYRHGMATTKGVRSPLYLRWAGMKRRCLNPHDKRYADYGGRGIKVCEAWMDFVNFKRDMGKGFQLGLTLDRVDVNGNYEPANCRWLPAKEQQRNRRSEHTRFVLNRILKAVSDHGHDTVVAIIKQELNLL